MDAQTIIAIDKKLHRYLNKLICQSKTWLEIARKPSHVFQAATLGNQNVKIVNKMQLNEKKIELQPANSLSQSETEYQNKEQSILLAFILPRYLQKQFDLLTKCLNFPFDFSSLNEAANVISEKNIGNSRKKAKQVLRTVGSELIR